MLLASRVVGAPRRGPRTLPIPAITRLQSRPSRESLGHTREGSDRVSRRRASASAAALMQVLTTGRAAQRRGEHGSQQCERCVSRPCLLIVKASCRRLATMPSADGDSLSSAFYSTSRRTQRSRTKLVVVAGINASAALAQPLWSAPVEAARCELAGALALTASGIAARRGPAPSAADASPTTRAHRSWYNDAANRVTLGARPRHGRADDPVREEHDCSSRRRRTKYSASARRRR